MTKPWIFLDVDGVLNHRDAFIAQVAAGRPSTHAIAAECLDVFKAFQSATGGDVVLSSTWRMWEPNKDVLRGHGLTWVGQTPYLGSRPRRDEIRAWLAEHDPRRERPVIVIDDGKDADLQRPWAHFVHTDMNHGLTHQHARLAFKWWGEWNMVAVGCAVSS